MSDNQVGSGGRLEQRDVGIGKANVAQAVDPLLKPDPLR
jgi:hypothetical protein